MRINLPYELMKPHHERNEDRMTFRHEGYMVKVCESCETEYLMGKDSPVKADSCGRNNCERKV